MDKDKTISDLTVEDFGRQHLKYHENSGYYTDVQFLIDVMGPLKPIASIKGKDCVDIGSGTGRWANMLVQAGAKTVAAIEPSEAIAVTKATNRHNLNVTFHNVTGEKVPDGPYDFIFSFGVLHHIPNPKPVVERAYSVLRPGGDILIWLYGKEGNQIYLLFLNIMRFFTVRINNKALDVIARCFVPLVRFYSRLAKILPLPLKRYMNDNIDKVGDYELTHVIYDQLDPHYAKYYSRSEAIALLESAGFVNVVAYHKSGYSWTVRGIKPQD